MKLGDWLMLLKGFILGDFKWTVLGMCLTLIGLAIGSVIGALIPWAFLRFPISAVTVGLVVWFGHELIDPLFHKFVKWYTDPLGPPLEIEK